MAFRKMLTGGLRSTGPLARWTSSWPPSSVGLVVEALEVRELPGSHELLHELRREHGRTRRSPAPQSPPTVGHLHSARVYRSSERGSMGEHGVRGTSKRNATLRGERAPAAKPRVLVSETAPWLHRPRDEARSVALRGAGRRGCGGRRSSRRSRAVGDEVVDDQPLYPSAGCWRPRAGPASNSERASASSSAIATS